MSNLACLVTSYLINSLWEVAAIGGTGWLVSRWLKRLGPQVQHVTWLVTLALAVVAPVLLRGRSFLDWIYLPGTVNEYPSMVFVAAKTGRSIGSSSILLPPFWIQVLSLFYLGALLYFATRLVWILHRTVELLRDAEPVSLGPESDELWNRSKRAFSVEGALILRSQRISGPVTIGFIRPVLLVPEGFTTKCKPHDLLAALAHECAHMKRRDFQKNLFYEIASLFIAFNPITWMIKSQIAQTREMICDGMATEKLIDARTYTQSLLRLVSMIPCAARVHTVNAIGIFDADILEKRIMIMRTKKQQLSSALKYCLMLSGALCLFSVAGGSAAMTRSIEAQTPAVGVNSDSAQKSQPKKTLACTWYDAQNKGHDGTCGRKKGDTHTPYCLHNDNKELGDLQTACESKLKE